LDARNDREIFCWSNHGSQGVVDDRINEAGVSTVPPVQFSAVEWNRAKVAVHKVVSPELQLELASHLKS